MGSTLYLGSLDDNPFDVWVPICSMVLEYLPTFTPKIAQM